MTSPLTPVGPPLFDGRFSWLCAQNNTLASLAERRQLQGADLDLFEYRSIHYAGRRLSDGEQQHGSICAADLGRSAKKPKDHAFLGTEALTIDAWNPMTGGLSFEGKFKFSGDGTGNQSALTQGGMIIGFFTYEKQSATKRFSHRDRLRSLYQQPQRPRSESDLDQCLQWLA